MNGKGPKNVYSKNIGDYTSKVNDLKNKNKRLIISRLIFFTVFVYFTIVSIRDNFNYLFLLSGLTGLFLFLFIVRLSLKNTNKLNFFNRLVDINSHELKALSYDFSPFGPGMEFIDPLHPFTYDLDIFGEGSIFQQINRTSSPTGALRLAEWLRNPLVDKNEIVNRQAAIKELRDKVKFRQEHIALLPENNETGKKRNQINEWANNLVSGKEYSFFKFVSTGLSIFSLFVFALVFSGVLPSSALFILLVFNGSFIFSKIKTVNREHGQISKQYDIISQFAGQVKHIESVEYSSTELQKLRGKILGDDISGSKSLKQLSKIITSFDYRLNFLVSIVLNGFFLWDFFCMIRLHKWKSAHAEQLKNWFEALDDFDAYQSMANFSYNNPGFVFAEITEKEMTLEAKKLGHPQIRPEKRVCNDIFNMNKGMFFIITGPNMAGKSTFLRTVGEALVLSQSGGPVCAENFKLKPVNLFSSMRTSDSLHKNESYFYAELKRLKNINENIGHFENIFIILDEILKGTNSTDKAEGSKAFLKKIIQKGATGIVATHDLTLGDLENEMPDNIQNYCFEADTDKALLKFDYSLKRGITTKMNATILMKQMGII